MVVEKYEYLLLELEARNREQQKEFLKDLLEGSKKQGKQEAQKMFLEEIDNLWKHKIMETSKVLFMMEFKDELKSKIGGEDD